ncbi:MAG: transglutaminase family protein [Gemmataceae bacterium]
MAGTPPARERRPARWQDRRSGNERESLVSSSRNSARSWGTRLPLPEVARTRFTLGIGTMVPAAEHLYLIPGDSPMGFRLPPVRPRWEEPENRQFMEEQDPFAPRGNLPTFMPPPVPTSWKIPVPEADLGLGSDRNQRGLLGLLKEQPRSRDSTHLGTVHRLG